ncbi:hypothetical protein A0H81_14382 [Grifola frondosa]|uniref:Uncharacterized protein n=1 Tax=Grifola frondosa TaxID=5627 RepID=A0A1C7LLE1_GRIFR|nr:hypothetical protein A0H81_14382 [Grifola frondosa]
MVIFKAEAIWDGSGYRDIRRETDGEVEATEKAGAITLTGGKCEGPMVVDDNVIMEAYGCQRARAHEVLGPRPGSE